MAENVVGRVHSIESFGAVDGPGVQLCHFSSGLSAEVPDIVTIQTPGILHTEKR